MQEMTPQRWLSLASGLVGTALTFLVGFDQASAEVTIPVLVYLLLGLAGALLGFANAFFTGATRMMITVGRMGRHP